MALKLGHSEMSFFRPERERERAIPEGYNPKPGEAQEKMHIFGKILITTSYKFEVD